MRFLRLPVKDPRTVARDIPGICDLLFPQLLPAIVAHLNREAQPVPGCTIIDESMLVGIDINAAMLFEVAYVRAEQILLEKNEDWKECLSIALARQSRYFDAILPVNLSSIEIKIANQTANNLIRSLKGLSEKWGGGNVVRSPIIPGFQWIAEGQGDFSIGQRLIEVKCTNKNFSSSDYRQILIYWLLSFSSSIEGGTDEWKTGILLNPRANKYIEIDFNELVRIVAAGRTKLELLELFSSIVGDYAYKLGE
ncbi:hypothetical protein [Pantoea ananatis]|uniref:hypothetical protein n=1 Tax=Pantoea ananas TaxID=553 RepID=UPI0002322F27|nr:hypothetical protein [Pantoea ananatis]AER31634.1 hypothetical protein PAGR_g1105 [Pantoea ananatis PA13]